MTNLTIQNSNLAVIRDENDKSVMSALRNSLFPGAKDESILMAIDYCKAKGLDIMRKPVHIVPMYVKDSKTGRGELRDTIMPGISLYRSMAMKTGAYAGLSEPEYGEEITETLSGVSVTYPKWCKITVRKVVQGNVCEYTVKEFWKENYATAKRDSLAPNAMWKKRPHGQLAKVAESQALRKAFEGEIGIGQPTMEEMEGKDYCDYEDISDNVRKPEGNTKTEQVASVLENISFETESPQEIGKYDLLKQLVTTHQVPGDIVHKWCEKAGVHSLAEMDDGKLTKCIEYVENKYGDR